MCKAGEKTLDLDIIGHLVMSNEKGQEVLVGTKEKDIPYSDLWGIDIEHQREKWKIMSKLCIIMDLSWNISRILLREDQIPLSESIKWYMP